MATLASRQQDLSQTIALLPPLLRHVRVLGHRARRLVRADAAVRPRTDCPGVKQLGPTITARAPVDRPGDRARLAERARAVCSRTSTPAVQNTASTIGATKSLLSAADELARCFTHNLIPTGNEFIQDPPVTTGLQVYQELFQSAVGIAGASGNFDGNGRYVRSSARAAERPTSRRRRSRATVRSSETRSCRVLGTRPAFTGSPPPLRRNVACYRNPAPNLNSATDRAGP